MTDTQLWDIYARIDNKLKKIITLRFNENMDRIAVIEEFKRRHKVDRPVLAFQYKGS